MTDLASIALASMPAIGIRTLTVRCRCRCGRESEVNVDRSDGALTVISMHR